MGAMKEYTSDSEMSVYLAFHLHDDSSFGEAVRRLIKKLKGLFGEGTTLKHTSPPGTGEREVVFRVQKPLIETEENLTAFFSTLEALFQEEASYMPTFTQNSEGR